MRSAIVLLVLLVLLAVMSAPAMAYDQTGAVGVGFRAGYHSVMKDPWSLSFPVPTMFGGELKLGLAPRWALAVTGTYGRTGDALLNTDAPLPTFDEADSDDPDRLRMRSYLLEFGPVVNLMPEENVNVFLTAGAGFGTWAVQDLDGRTVMVPDGSGGMFEFRDQQMTIMVGGGVEWWPWESVPQISFNGSLRYHIYTNVFSDFKDADELLDKVVGSDGLDRPKGLLEFGIGVTAYLSKCPDEDDDGVCDVDDRCPGTPACARPVDSLGCPYDSDGDGVYNGCDSCEGTPAGCLVEKTGPRPGCHKDDDNDGVCNGVDRCPNTPAGCEVDAAGCALDDDSDGVPNCLDQSPGTPACCKVDANGRPTDEDNDTVCDGCDECPQTPAGHRVDTKGCPMDVIQIHKEVVVLAADVGFQVNKYDLQQAGRDRLDEVAEALAAMPTIKVRVEGYTDSDGSEDYNKTLSEKRAGAVRDYLVNTHNLNANRFTVVGYGEANPVAPNDSPANKAMNRRVELRVVR